MSRASPAKKFGDPNESAARLGALGRARLDARHDGHGAQPRPQRRDRRGAGASHPATSASPMTATAASSRCIPTSCSASSTSTSRRSSRLHKDQKGYTLDTELSADDWAELIERYKARVKEETGEDFPQDPHEQLWGAIGAVFGSWMNAARRSPIAACTTSRKAGAPRSTCRRWCSATWATTSATGVAFTRNPSTGEKALYGEFLINAQGEDVVAGIRTPQEITEARARPPAPTSRRWRRRCRRPTRSWPASTASLEKHYRDMQDLEFTVEKGKLWMLQTRSGKRTAKAALRIAVELANEGLITQEEAVTRVDPAALDQLLHPTIDPKAERKVIATGLPASPGAASGEIVFSADEAESAEGAGQEGDPGARRDLAGGHPRHARRRGHPHHARRHDLARGGGRARHGQALRLRRGLAARRLCGADDDAPPATTFKKGDIDHHRRLDRPGARRPRRRCSSRRSPASSPR